MKWFLTVLFIITIMTTPFAQDNTPVVKRYSKIHLDKKYIISETVYADGHIDNYITSVPLNDLRNLRSDESIAKTSNINWDEDADVEGLQMTFANVEAIENAFNNAIANTEIQLDLKDGTMERITLGQEFLNLNEDIQSQILLEKVISALTSQNVFEIEKKVEVACNKDLNDAIFLTNGEDDLAIPHIQAIYNWVFADQYTGWYNRSLILNGEFLGQNNKEIESINKVVESIVANPTFESVASISLHASDNKESKLAMDISHDEITQKTETPLMSGDE